MLPAPIGLDGPGCEDLLQSLRSAMVGDAEQTSLRARDAIVSIMEPIQSNESRQARSYSAYRQLRRVVARLGPSSAIASDMQLVFSLFHWAAIAAPDLCTVLSGHFTLTVGAIQKLGTETVEQRQALTQLEDAGHVGVFLLTELGFGSNVLKLQTEARWDGRRRCFVLYTPGPAAMKFMPNVADERVPKTVVIAARLIADDRDQGVFLFLMTLRTPVGLADGVRVHPMPETGFCPMDNALICFDGAEVTEGCWLNGGIAWFDRAGQFHSTVSDLRGRFHNTIEQLQFGRVALAVGALAGARAALWLTVRYARQRITAGGVAMIDRDNVYIPLTLSAARLYAMTALAHSARTALARRPAADDRAFTLAMLAKPLLSSTALSVLQECRERLGSQGMFRANMVTDYIGLAQAAITAEGENQVLDVASGRAMAASQLMPLPVPAIDAPPWHLMLDQRARALVGSTNPHSGAESIEIAQAAAVAWAVHALRTRASSVEDRYGVLDAVAELYGLDQLLERAAWYVANTTTDATQIRALIERRAALIAWLAPYLPVLVEAFDVDSELVPSAFVCDDYQQAWASATGWWPFEHPHC